jgi:hypothetical protein
MRNMTLVVETVVLVMACVDCSGGDTTSKTTPQTANTCISGSACTCDDGSSGQKLCDSGSGVFIQCECRRSGLPRGTTGNNSLPGGATPIMATGSSGFDAPTIIGGSTGSKPPSTGAAGTGASGASGDGSGGAAGAAGAAGATAGSSGAAGAAGSVAGSAGH